MEEFVMREINLRVIVLFCVGASLSCRDVGEQQQTTPSFISTDAQLFAFITQTEPFATYSLFPNADSVTAGALNGSNAHQPQVRVSMNARALSALVGGRLPSGATFPDSSVIFKQIRTGGVTTLYAVLFKDKDNPLAGNGWLWAEYRPNGAVDFSITTKGSGCIGCHSREQGTQNDFVRTFERQR
jgi:hypothetical protein